MPNEVSLRPWQLLFGTAVVALCCGALGGVIGSHRTTVVPPAFAPAQNAFAVVHLRHLRWLPRRRRPTIRRSSSARRVVEIDIRKYFDSIDHGRLREVLRGRIRDGVILRGFQSLRR